MSWDFYGRTNELKTLSRTFTRGRFFFARVTGRRRIGKTTLVQRALGQAHQQRSFYVQIPDSGPSGVISAVRDAIETFAIDTDKFTCPDNLLSFAGFIEQLTRAGYIVVLDEFQYFNRKQLNEFTSHLQAKVDILLRDAEAVRGGLVVLGSIHADLVALLDDKHAPLYNRTTHQLALQHLDITSVMSIIRAHSTASSERLLFLWTLFEGVPKFYRDAFEQDVLRADRHELLATMFFRSSSPLRTEAENWFLSELRGQYDAVLKFVARNPGCSNGDIVAHMRELNVDKHEKPMGGYIQVLIERYQMLERRLPIFSKPTGRRGRYYVRDNFLRAWLDALKGPVSAVAFRPEDTLVKQANARLEILEGHIFERIVARLYEERSRRGVGDFNLTHRIEGYWDKSNTEIDLVAVDDESKIIRFGSCKRNPNKLIPEAKVLETHIERFLQEHGKYRCFRIERFGISPHIPADLAKNIEDAGLVPQSLEQLLNG